MDINIEYFLDEIETRFDRKMDEKTRKRMGK